MAVCPRKKAESLSGWPFEACPFPGLDDFQPRDRRLSHSAHEADREAAVESASGPTPPMDSAGAAASE